MIVTFYSFKGGVGRSMALANIAELYFRRGLKVLVVDFDLEAPGLETFFLDQSTVTGSKLANKVYEHRGIIDLLLSYKQLRRTPAWSGRPESETKDDAEDSFPYPVEPLDEFSVPLKESGTAQLSLIRAGLRHPDDQREYSRKVLDFSWDDFFTHWDGEQFFEWFRREADKLADIVLVDSRTGITEMGGVCTHQLADAVVLLFAPNDQNLKGIAGVARSLKNSDLKKARHDRPLDLVFVPSRVDSRAEKKLLDRAVSDFREQLGEYLAARPQTSLEPYIDLQIPYVPYYSFHEEVAVRDMKRVSPSARELTAAYEQIIRVLDQSSPKGIVIAGALERAGRGEATTEDTEMVRGAIQGGELMWEAAKEGSMDFITIQSASGKKQEITITKSAESWIRQNTNARLAGSQRSMLQLAILDAFTIDELNALLEANLGGQLRHISESTDKGRIVSDLIRTAENEGWTLDLLDAMRAARPRRSDLNALVVELCAQHEGVVPIPTSGSVGTVFVSYSHRDEAWKDRLVTQLKVLKNLSLLETWDDRRIGAGQDWRLEIESAMSRATVAVLLISADFLSSAFIVQQEVPHLLARREAEGLHIIPVIVRPCVWRTVPWLTMIQARPKDGRPLSSATEAQAEEELAEIADEIAQILAAAGE